MGRIEIAKEVCRLACFGMGGEMVVLTVVDHIDVVVIVVTVVAVILQPIILPLVS
jgi:dihydrodipicolinate synthase/N-acetylneuraminate lyase